MAGELIFTHPSKKIKGLKVPIKPNEITWGYGLNVQTYPTYGGEVVQILSCFVEDMTVTGHVRSYRQLEKLYGWFIDYMQIATQKGEYDTRPVTMRYPHRGWTFKIYPKSLPSFKYGRDVVAPEWTLQAAIVEPDRELKENIMSEAQIEAVKDSGVKLFGKVTGEIGFQPDDPFSSPDGARKASKQLKKDGSVSRDEYGNFADWYNNLIPSYLEGTFEDLSADYSRPSGLGKKAGDPQRGAWVNPQSGKGGRK